MRYEKQGKSKHVTVLYKGRKIELVPAMINGIEVFTTPPEITKEMQAEYRKWVVPPTRRPWWKRWRRGR